MPLNAINEPVDYTPFLSEPSDQISHTRKRLLINAKYKVKSPQQIPDPIVKISHK